MDLGLRTRRRCVVAFLYVALLLLLSGCASVRYDLPKSYTESIPDDSATYFGGFAQEWGTSAGTDSGVLPFQFGMDALGARLAMADKAEKSIDLQYFLMKDDTTGDVISTALLRAAERGVRIRFLLDDVFTTASDIKLLSLNKHRNIEVRLFNPISRRGLHTLNFIGHFRRANRRMHNKSFTVDNAVSIVGGRNLADEYFQLQDDSVFADFDVFVLGPVVKEISASFDEYWNHSLAVPIEQLASAKQSRQIENLQRQLGEAATDRYESVFEQANDSELMRDIASGTRSLFAADARVIADDPEKIEPTSGSRHLRLATELGQLLSEAERELLFVTPYYVPGRTGIDFLQSLLDKGLRVVVVTNSLASNNHIPVHSAYSGYRRKVVRMGVELHEARANAGRESQGDGSPERLTLHTKLIVIDRRYLFVGSLNLDPRSIQINAEMGLLIDSPQLASQVALGITQDLPNTTYRIAINDKGRLEWHGIVNQEQVMATSEPLASRWRRFKAWILKIVPEGQL